MNTIDPRATEAAAGAIYGALLHYPGINGTECDRIAEAALSAAAPFLYAQSLNDEAALWQKYHDEGHPEAYPYGWDEVAAGLRARATEHEKEAR